MNRNEVSWNFLGEQMFEIEANRYPSMNLENIEKKIAAFAGVASTNVVLMAGGDQVIEKFLLICLLKGARRIGIVTPSFSMFQIFAERLGLEVFPLKLDSNFDIPVEGEALWNLDKLYAIILCSPNNPTGNVLNRGRVENLLYKFSGPVLLDQAYLEFTSASNDEFKESDFSAFIATRAETVILRTFSKAWGLAGLRLGYALASNDFIASIRSTLAPYPISSWSLAALERSIENSEEFQDSVQKLVQLRNRWSAALKELSCIDKVYPSSANFIFLNVKDITDLIKKLGSASNRLRDYQNFAGRGAFRLTIDLDMGEATWPQTLST